VVAARAGETIAQLLARSDAAAWGAEMTAVANELEPGTPLVPPLLVKVPRAEPYRPGH